MNIGNFACSSLACETNFVTVVALFISTVELEGFLDLKCDDGLFLF